MAFNVTDFITQGVDLDGARPNLFNISIPVFDQKLTFTARAAQLPGSTIGVIEQPYFGRQLKYAGNRTFPEWTVTVVNDEDFVIRSQLEEWMRAMNGHETNLAETYHDAYAFDADVIQFAKNGDEIKRYTFKYMWPSDIAAIDLDWGTNDTIEEYQVTFVYNYWFSEGQTGSVQD